MSTTASKRTTTPPEALPTVEAREVMNAPQAAEYLTVSLPWLRHATQAGEVPHSRLGRRIVYERSELNRWVRERRAPKRRRGRPAR